MAAPVSFALQPPPAATATAKKGPIQLTLRLYKTTLKSEKSLWYQIELKNIGKEPIEVEDRIFRDPWVMRYNIRDRVGIYFDVIPPAGTYKGHKWPTDSGITPLLSRPIGGLGIPHWDWHREGYSAADKKELADLEAKWAKDGLSETEKVKAKHRWVEDWTSRKESEERADPAKKRWLAPGASTTTLAWAYRDPDPNPSLHSPFQAELRNEEAPVGDYAQLFDLYFRPVGKYRIRAVYDYAFSKESRRKFEKLGIKIAPWEVRIETPDIGFEVVK